MGTPAKLMLAPGRRRRDAGRKLIYAALHCAILAAAVPTMADEAGLTPAGFDDEPRLAALLWEHSPEVLEARQRSMAAASEEIRAHLYPNPLLDLGWNTIPVGRTNPSDLNDPIGNVPNYGVVLSELFELGKRGPRQAATAAERTAANAEAVAVFADRWFELLQTIGKIAMNEERVFVLDRQVDESDHLLALERARAEKGEIARMQVARSETEHLRLVGVRDAARTELEQAQATCSAMLAAPCPTFGSEPAARAFLERGARAMPAGDWSDEIEARRPDLTALAAAIRAADERITLAKHQVIPDVTLRLGYTYDTFVVSGNQRQSLGVGMQLPLPVSDRGQADLAAASALLSRARDTRAALITSGRLALAATQRRRQLVANRLQQLQTAIQKSDELRATVEGAAREGGASQVDILLARRRLQEVLLERTELDFDFYDATLEARHLAAQFPQPQITGPEAIPADAMPTSNVP